MRRGLAPAVAAVAAMAILAAPAAGQSGSYGETTSILVVEVPVTVTDGGRPLRGLTRDNFELFDGRQRQEITSFEVIDLATVPRTAEGAGALGLAGRRYFLLLFDLSFSQPEALVRARRAASELVLDRLHPSDLVAVATYSAARGAELVLSFTPDREQARLAVDTLGAPGLLQRGTDPLALLSLAPQGAVEAAGGAGGTGRAGVVEGLVREHLEAIAATTDRVDREEQGRQVAAMTRALADLAGAMGRLDGRKHVVLLSQGFDSRLLTGDAETKQETRTALESGEIWNVDSDQTYGQAGVVNRLEGMLDAFRRADAAIHAIDIGGLQAGGDERSRASGIDSLVMMARGTGGEVFENRNDLGESLASLLDQTSVTYLLAFQPQSVRDDGAFRRIRVRLEGVPGNPRLSHRRGYVTPDARAVPHPLQERLAATQALHGARAGGDIGVSVLAAALPGEAGGGRVPLLLEIDGETLVGTARNEAVQAEIHVYAFDGEGSVHGYLGQALTLPPGAALAEGRRGIKFYGSVALPPGDYALRVLVRDLGSGRSALQIVPVSVPDFAAAPVLSPALFPEPLDRWLLVRQGAAEGEALTEYPYRWKGEVFVPAARPVALRAAATHVSLLGFGLPEGDVRIAAEILRHDGRGASGGSLQVVERVRDPQRGEDQLLAQLDTSGLDPGDYTLLVEVTDPASGATASSATPFAVSGEGAVLAAGEPAAGAPAGVDAAADPTTTAAAGPGLPEVEELSVQTHELERRYREVLSRLAQGDREGAMHGLLVLEQQALSQARNKDTGDKLGQIERRVVGALTRGQHEGMVPILMLHQESYGRYAEGSHGFLTVHAVAMVETLAVSYAKQGGRGARALAGQFLAGLGGDLQHRGGLSTARRLFELALQYDPDNTVALLGLGALFEKTGAYADAVAPLRSLVAADPRNAEATLRLGMVLWRTGQKEETRRLLEGLTVSDGEDWILDLAFQQLAAFHGEAGHWRGAAEVLLRGVERLPASQRLRLALSYALDRSGGKGEALRLAHELTAGSDGPVVESPRSRYNRWPRALLERQRLVLAANAEERLPVLARVFGPMAAQGTQGAGR